MVFSIAADAGMYLSHVLTALAGGGYIIGYTGKQLLEKVRYFN